MKGPETTTLVSGSRVLWPLVPLSGAFLSERSFEELRQRLPLNQAATGVIFRCRRDPHSRTRPLELK